VPTSVRQAVVARPGWLPPDDAKGPRSTVASPCPFASAMQAASLTRESHRCGAGTAVNAQQPSDPLDYACDDKCSEQTHNTLHLTTTRLLSRRMDELITT
jgi:hypothetical protein